MSKRAILRCDGSIERGFGVILEIRDTAEPTLHTRQSSVFTEVTGA